MIFPLLNVLSILCHDSTVNYSTTFKSHPSQIEINNARLDATQRWLLTFLSFPIWGRRNLVSFNASKTQILHLSTRQQLPDTYPLFFDNTRLSPSFTLNIFGLDECARSQEVPGRKRLTVRFDSILGLSLSNDLNWKFHISSRSAVVSTPGYESAGPGSMPAGAVGAQPTQLFIHPLRVGR